MSLWMSKALSLSSLFLLASGFIAYGYFATRFVKQLRTRHEKVWAELGSPVVISRGSSKAKFFSYLSGQAYRQLNDETLNRLGGLARNAMYFMMVSTPLAMVIMLTVGIICAPGSCR
jgi:hypothetical protein